MGKTVYENFLLANNKLYDCYKAVAPAQFEAMNKQDQENLCRSEREAVATFLKNN